MIEERTSGKIRIIPHFGESLMKSNDSWEDLKQGVADMAAYHTARMPGRFSLADMAVKPGLGLTGLKLGGPDAQLASSALWAAYEQFPEMQAEWGGLKLLALHVGPSKCYHTVDKAVRILQDAKGLKIQCAGEPEAKIVAALGSVPVKMTAEEAYKTMKNGEIDGYLGGGEQLIVGKLGEVSKNTILIDAGHGTIFWIAMNQQKWDGLPDDVKEVVSGISGEWLSAHVGKGRDKKELDFRMQARDEMQHKFYEPSSEEAAEWTGKLTPLADEYAGQLESKGLPGRKLLEFYKQYAGNRHK